jgi:hypothetical protein
MYFFLSARSDGLPTSEREELNRLRRENRVLGEDPFKSRGLVCVMNTSVIS